MHAENVVQLDHMKQKRNAHHGARTHDHQLKRLALYQLS